MQAAPWPCWQQAADAWQVPARLLVAIAWLESSFDAGAVHRNADGSEDLGAMQINSRHLPRLAREWGITRAALLGDACLNVHVGAMLLAESFARHGNTWRAVGAYNAGSDAKRARYVLALQRRLRRLP